MFFPDLEDAGLTHSWKRGYVAEGSVYVGWLKEAQVFDRTEPMEASTEYLAALRWLIGSVTLGPIQIFSTRGFHACPFCEGKQARTGSQHFVVPGTDRNYLVPSLISHYVSAHFYRAPPEFVEALVAVYRENGAPC